MVVEWGPDAGDRVRRLREALRLTGRQLGERLGVTGSAVSAWEHGTSKMSAPVWILFLVTCRQLGGMDEAEVEAFVKGELDRIEGTPIITDTSN
jgi:transcriptional regulator with XRE-family HTH domain